MPVIAHESAGKGPAAVTDSSGNVAITSIAAAGAESENTNPNRAADQSASLLELAFSPSAALVVVAALPLLSVTAAALLPTNL